MANILRFPRRGRKREKIVLKSITPDEYSILWSHLRTPLEYKQGGRFIYVSHEDAVCNTLLILYQNESDFYLGFCEEEDFTVERILFCDNVAFR